jgi:hypothetical protein
MRTLIIPEDFRKDQYLLKPLFERLFREFGRRQTRVLVCNQPLLQGVNEALKLERLREILERYPMFDLFILCVDRDGNLGRQQRLDQIEQEFASLTTFMAVNAWEELETWTLAGLDLPSDWRWPDVRASVSVKEEYFEAYATQRGVADGPGGGRRTLGEEAARRIDAIRLKCPEDFGHLADRIKRFAAGRGA